MEICLLTKVLATKLFTYPFKLNTRNAVDLAHKIHGNNPSQSKGPPIIILHGLLGSKRNWDSLSKRIAGETQKCVVAADVRNHGESPHVSSHTYPELASDVSQLLSKLSIAKAIIIGHSMGGRTGMVLALTEPSKVHNLVVVDISPVSTAGILNDFFPRLIDVMKSVPFEKANNVATARAIAKETFKASGLVDNVESLAFVIMNVGTRDNKVGWMCNVDALKEYFTSIATFPPEMAGKTYGGPTLFIGGKLSNYIPPEDLNGIKGFFPTVELKYIPGVGHNVHAEDPNSFFNMVKEFLNKNP